MSNIYRANDSFSMDNYDGTIILINQAISALNSNVGYAVPPIQVVRRLDNGMCEMSVAASEIPFLPADRNGYGLFNYDGISKSSYVTWPLERFILVG
jgi:hypothetical protein